MGLFHSCAVTTSGGFQCWGSNLFGELGDGQTCGISSCLTPVDVLGLAPDAAALGLGGTHTCAVMSTGAVKCWGFNGSGRLGDGTTTQRTTPVDVNGMGPVDTDSDGCTDVQEAGLDEKLGGLRDPKNPHDYYDVNGDLIIDLSNDIFGVIQEYAPNGYVPGTTDHTGNKIVDDYDRGPSAGPNPWNMTAPDGVIDLSIDILGVIMQYNHSCQ